MGKYYMPKSRSRENRYMVSVKEYSHYQREGYLIVRGLLSPEDIAELYAFAEKSRLQKENSNKSSEKRDASPLGEEFAQATRIHMLSRLDEVAERGMLHPRILDVTEAIIGPDVYAVQSMLFLNPPGKGGQGWHQDACYIKTHPDTLVGAWIALEPADEENGCLWVVPGSNHEPIYPPVEVGGGNVHALDSFGDLNTVQNVSHLDDEINTLSKVVANYPPAISVPLNAGDVLFFHSHLLHRSFPNKSVDRFRRSYVCHYCNARSWIPWDHDGYEGDSGNYRQILARGKTHMPYAAPTYGTEIFLADEDNEDSVTMVGTDDGMMMPMGMEKDK
ncbi:phytanoyl-CoA dioxygenase family protein [Paenibacillus psychroresistens]|uniref:Phytanoyl-CoA dioxygenase family protein n=1 Tax=Paenibacillus psychroresistens TaxID=1778678 RepID=A0A6B8RQT2_9BACL|nr:phytanoyl-CoA dioxygenase family protein [Paenibacillus psychroresistens]QGQ98740.1 phytanoyl-CoA dioxygenase family protein [Paenibacillus psychroresistens]